MPRQLLRRLRVNPARRQVADVRVSQGVEVNDAPLIVAILDARRRQVVAEHRGQ
ncbi:MAG: hypothetical protein PHU85_08135 [Phycisphaerae bacterium]|nr:hypothetical protein [Phycisphaerae bacterium]